MSSLNPLSYNAWLQTIAGLGVYNASEASGIWTFDDAVLQQLVPQILSYAEGRIQRDLDLLAAQSSNTYALTAGQSVFQLPVGDFQTVHTVELIFTNGSTVVNSKPLTPVSKEFIQNVYGNMASAKMPKFFAMYGSAFGDEGDAVTNILLGPTPNYAYGLRVTGTAMEPSLYSNASNGPADTAYTYISQFYPDLLVMASMIFIAAYQRNFSATSDDPQMPMSYEKQYQVLREGAIGVENRRKQQASGWSSYSTPASATPTR